MRELGPERGLLVQFLLDHFGLKLVALGLAIVLFVLVRCETETVRTVQLDVIAELPALDSRQVLVSQLPARLEVELRGPRARLAELQLSELTPIRVDLRRDGTPAVDFSEMVRVSKPLRVVHVRPNRLPLAWRRRAERSVPVRLDVAREAGSGLELAPGVELTPARVAITGPADEVSKLRWVDTEPLSIARLGAGTHALLVHLIGLTGHLAYVDSSSVAVRLDVRRTSYVRPQVATDRPTGDPVRAE